MIKKRFLLSLLASSLILLGLGSCSFVQAQVKITRDVSYGSDPQQKMDVYEQNNSLVALPALIFIHGGGWVGGDKSDISDNGINFLIGNSYVGFNINYRLASSTGPHFPAQLDDAQRAVRWVRAHAEQYHVDIHRIGAWGSSAGGNLASLLGTQDTRDNSDTTLAAYSSRVSCVADVAGPVDITTFTTAGAEVFITDYIGQTRAAAPQLYTMASPLYSIDQNTVPFAIFQGTDDILVPYTQAVLFDAALRQAGIQSTLFLYPGETHDFTQSAVDVSNHSRSFFDTTLSAGARASINSGIAFPNPFRPSQGHTVMNFSRLPANARIRIYTLTGEQVTELSTDYNGSAQWDVNNESGKHVASGVYFSEIEANGERQVMKVIVQR